MTTASTSTNARRPLTVEDLGPKKYQFFYFETTAALHAAEATVDADYGDIAYNHETGRFVKVRDVNVPLGEQVGWAKQFVLNVADDTPHDVDILDRYSAFLTDVRVTHYFRVYIWPKNCSLSRIFNLYTSDRRKDRTLLQRYAAMTLTYQHGVIETVHVTYWSIFKEQSASERNAAFKHVRIKNGKPTLEKALEMINDTFLKISRCQASLLIWAQMGDAPKTFERNCYPLVGRHSRMPTDWFIDDVQHSAPLGSLITLIGPATTRNDAYNVLLSQSRTSGKISKQIESFVVLNYFPENERQYANEVSVNHIEAFARSQTAIDSRQLPTIPIRGSTFRWSTHQKALLDLAIALSPLALPAYVIEWIFDWLVDSLPFMWRSTDVERLKVIQGVNTSRNKIIGNRTLTYKHRTVQPPPPPPISEFSVISTASPLRQTVAVPGKTPVPLSALLAPASAEQQPPLSWMNPKPLVNVAEPWMDPDTNDTIFPGWDSTWSNEIW